MSAYCIKVSEHGDFLTSVFKQEQYMSIFLAAHVLLVSVLNPCFLLHAHFFCAPRKNIDWKTVFYSFCYFRMLLFIELLNPSLLCSTLRSAFYSNPNIANLSTRHRLVPIFIFMLFTLDVY